MNTSMTLHPRLAQAIDGIKAKDSLYELDEQGKKWFDEHK